MSTPFRIAALFLAASMPAWSAPEGGEPLARLMLREFDTNSDSMLDSGEWKGGIGSSFDRLDASADGFIAPAEVDELRGDMAAELGEVAALAVVAVIRTMIASLDQNGDQLVSREEFGVLTEGVFVKLDQDKDGLLSALELADLPAKLAASKTE